MTNKENEVDDLQLMLMEVIGESDKTFNVPLSQSKNYKYQFGTNIATIERKMMELGYKKQEINQAVENLVSAGFAVDFRAGGVYVIALTPETVNKFDIKYHTH